MCRRLASLGLRDSSSFIICLRYETACARGTSPSWPRCSLLGRRQSSGAGAGAGAGLAPAGAQSSWGHRCFTSMRPINLSVCPSVQPLACCCQSIAAAKRKELRLVREKHKRRPQGSMIFVVVVDLSPSCRAPREARKAYRSCWMRCRSERASASTPSPQHEYARPLSARGNSDLQRETRPRRTSRISRSSSP